MAMVYQWKDGSQQGGSAQVVGEQLEAIRLANDGTLAARDVVVAARPVESPLHRYFEWRDNVAAMKYREEQARNLIRKVVVIADEVGERTVPAFVCIAKGETEFGPYQATRVALADPTSREYVLNQARKELEAWRRKYRDLTELAAVIAVIDEQLAA